MRNSSMKHEASRNFPSTHQPPLANSADGWVAAACCRSNGNKSYQIINSNRMEKNVVRVRLCQVHQYLPPFQIHTADSTGHMILTRSFLEQCAHELWNSRLHKNRSPMNLPPCVRHRKGGKGHEEVGRRWDHQRGSIRQKSTEVHYYFSIWR